MSARSTLGVISYRLYINLIGVIIVLFLFFTSKLSLKYKWNLIGKDYMPQHPFILSQKCEVL